LKELRTNLKQNMKKV